MTTQVQLLASVAGGAFTPGEQAAAFGQTLDLKPASTVGLSSIRYEIYDYPPGFPVPAGWTQDPSTDFYTYSTTNVTQPPPTIHLPSSGANNWGFFMLRLVGNDNPLTFNADGTPNTYFNPQLTDEACCIDIPSPNLGMPGIGNGLNLQYDSFRGWVGALMASLRLADVASSGSGVAFGGDLTGNAITQTVVAIHGASVPLGGALNPGNVLQVSAAAALAYGPLNLANANSVSGVLGLTHGGTGLNAGGADGTVLTMSGGVASWASPAASYTLSGDVTGALVATVVGKVNGATVPAAGSLVVGNLAQVTGTSALGYGPLNLAGGANYVTGLLPAGNQAPQTLVGDVTGPANGNAVVAVHGATYPAAGALVAGNVPIVTGVSSVAYGALDLGNAATAGGTLPIAHGGTGLNALGAANALLGMDPTGSVLEYFTLGGDGSLASGDLTVTGIGGIAFAPGTPTNGQVPTFISGTGLITWTTPSAGGTGALKAVVVSITSTGGTSSTAIASTDEPMMYILVVQTPFTGSGPAMAFGRTGATSQIFGTGTVDTALATAGTYSGVLAPAAFGAAAAPLVTMTGASAGAATMVLLYATPNT